MAPRLTAQEQSQVGRIAALTRWSREDPQVNAERGQRGLRAKFEREVDPDGTLPLAERLRRADCAYRAHMARLALARCRAARLAAEAKAAEAVGGG